MNHEVVPFLSIAAVAAVTHTLLGPDHYAPLTAFAKAHHWTRKKTVWMTSLCGLGHIVSSIVLGGIGVFLNFSLRKWQIINSLRQEIAAWLWITAGLFYLVWAVKERYRRAHGFNALPYEAKAGARGWLFFVIFVLGPCEPLMLLMQHPIARDSLSVGTVVVGVFGIVTILTMVVLVLALSAGPRCQKSFLIEVQGKAHCCTVFHKYKNLDDTVLDSFRLRWREHYAHFAAAGVMIFCGLGMRFLGL